MVEPDALPFPGARQVFDTRNTTIFKKDGHTTQPTRFFVASLTTQEAGSVSAKIQSHTLDFGLWTLDFRL